MISPIKVKTNSINTLTTKIFYPTRIKNLCRSITNLQRTKRNTISRKKRKMCQSEQALSEETVNCRKISLGVSYAVNYEAVTMVNIISPAGSLFGVVQNKIWQ